MRLLPREEEFFTLFIEVANRNKEAVEHLRQLFQAAPDRRTPHVEAIKRLEHEADQVTHEVVNRLDRTFVTPLDREDIHQLASDLDDVMDAMDGTARRAQIFRLGPSPDGVLRLCEVLKRMMTALSEAVNRLKKGDDVMRYCVEAKQLEEEGAMQVFTLHEGLRSEPILAVVGELQFDVLQSRLETEYNVETTLTNLPYKLARWVDRDVDEVARMTLPSKSRIATDRNGHAVVLFTYGPGNHRRLADGGVTIL